MERIPWHSFKDERPEEDSPLGFLVMHAATGDATVACYDEFAGRFVVYNEVAHGRIQIPVTHWATITLP